MLRRSKQYDIRSFPSPAALLASSSGVLADQRYNVNNEVPKSWFTFQKLLDCILQRAKWVVFLIFVLVLSTCLWIFYCLRTVNSSGAEIHLQYSPMSFKSLSITAPKVASSVRSNPIISKNFRKHPKLKSIAAQTTQDEMPLVDHSILDKLHLLSEANDDWTADDSGYVLDSDILDHPPLITAIPQSSKISGAHSVRANVEIYDTLFCGVYPCRLLFPVRIPGQESNARMYFMQITKLARELGRTIVLPNVADGRLGACLEYNFATYFDPRSLLSERINGRHTAITFNAFVQWAAKRPEDPLAQVIVLKNSSEVSGAALRQSQGALVLTDSHHSPSKQLKCLKTRTPRLRIGTLPSITITPLPGNISTEDDEKYNESFSKAIIETLVRPYDFSMSDKDDELLEDLDFALFDDETEHVQDVPNLLLLNWDLQKELFSMTELSPLNYSLRLFSFVSRTLHHLQQRFIAIHWRMETVTSENVIGCTSILLEKLEAVIKDYEKESRENIEAVWFASDYPFPIFTSSNQSEQQPLQLISRSISSDAGNSVSHESHEAIATLRRAFEPGGPLTKYRLLDLHEIISIYRRNRQSAAVDGFDISILRDSGVWGIIDKIVASQATVFLSGKDSCGRISSFTRQITDEKSNRQEFRDGRSIVDFFR